MVLLNPATWEDKNDAEPIINCRKNTEIPNIFAICFGIGVETIHHWNTYASGISGCCIEFDEIKLLNSFRQKEGIRYGDVEYKRISEVTRNKPKFNKIPFLKRYPYQCEKEFRIIWEGETNSKAVEFDIDLCSINKITLNQEMPDTIVDVIKGLCKEVSGRALKINRSTLYQNEKWILALKIEG